MVSSHKHNLSWKKQQAETLVKLFNDNKVIAVADVNGFPSSLFQTLRKKLHGKAVFKVPKIRVAQKALAASQKKDSGIDKYLTKSCGLIFTSMDSFELYSYFKKNKGNIAAKTGVIAPEDIAIPAGDTGLPPGPALSDLKQAGLNVRPMGATIHIMEDKVVTKKGEPVLKAVADTLSKLDIKPIKVGMNVVAAYDNTQLYEANVLDIDTDKVFDDFKSAYSGAFNLALNISYLTPDTLPLLLRKAIFDSMNLALNAEIYTKGTIEIFISKANIQATVLKGFVKEAPAEEPKPEEKKEEAKAETKDEEKKEEKKEEPSAEEKKEESASLKPEEKKPTAGKPKEKKEEVKEAKPAEKAAQTKSKDKNSMKKTKQSAQTSPKKEPKREGKFVEAKKETVIEKPKLPLRKPATQGKFVEPKNVEIKTDTIQERDIK